jgi:predicted RNase H-like HicB family nuclease
LNGCGVFSAKSQAAERTFNVLVEQDEDGFYVGSAVELPGCHTQAKSLDQLGRRVKEVIEGYLEVSSDQDEVK